MDEIEEMKNASAPQIGRRIKVIKRVCGPPLPTHTCAAQRKKRMNDEMSKCSDTHSDSAAMQCCQCTHQVAWPLSYGSDMTCGTHGRQLVEMIGWQGSELSHVLAEQTAVE